LLVATRGETDRRGNAVACGIADGLLLPRSFISFVADDPDTLVERTIENEFVYQSVKRGRNSIIS
jgi:hypothetical protein